MSIIDNVEQYMKRYDHLIEKQTRRHNKGKTLTKEEDDELQKLRPTVLTPLTMMFEILFDTVKTNQEIRRNNKTFIMVGGGAVADKPKAAAPTATATATAAAAYSATSTR